LKPNSPFLSHHAVNSDTDFLIDGKNWDNIKIIRSGQILDLEVGTYLLKGKTSSTVEEVFRKGRVGPGGS
jgi:hypothetical protein